MNPLRLTLKKSELMRDFIYDSLYNPIYGYFSKNVNIFKSPETIKFSQLKDQDDYFHQLKSLYDLCDNSSNEGDNNKYNNNKNNNNTPYNTPYNTPNTNINYKFHQLWHTPSELFKPFYGRAITRFITENSKSKDPLIIYEIGPGNGTLAQNILDCLKEDYKEIYESVEYNLIEISDQLRGKQAKTLEPFHGQHIKFPNIPILDIPENFKDERPCWVLGMEVLDNLSHDLIKFRNDDGALLEAVVHTNESATYGSIPGKYWREFREAQDDLITEYVGIGDQLGWQWASLKGNPLRRLLERYSPIDYINPWSCEYIPTDAFKLLKGLIKSFPNHRVLFSDFDELPDAVEGHGGPVVQTRFRGTSVPCSTVLLERGLFDIFFPTNFTRLAQLHKKLSVRSNNSNLIIEKHAEFMKKWLDPREVKETTTRSGYNPIIQDFENVSFYSFK